MKILMWLSSVLILMGSIGMFFTQHELQNETNLPGKLSYHYDIKDDVENIDLTADMNDIKIIKSNDQDIHLNVSKAKSEGAVQYHVENQTLYIDSQAMKKRQPGLFRFDFNTQNQAAIELALPDQQYKDIRLQADVGSFDIDKIKSQKVEITAGVGEVAINKVESREAAFTVDTGEIKVEQLKTDHLNFNVDIGSLTLGNLEKQMNIKGEVGTGEAYLNYKEVPDNADINLYSEMGDIETNDLMRKQGIIGSGKTKIDIQVDIGSLEIDKE
ncbi:hypothetical protein ERX37_01540 [Macrococcus hajekii]|uniref:DUF4097 domain-containing protein n=1 Tax=Macrococcus hajekii TaxID=198482 RepID=A0A4R6BMB2_9STAP|nr:DUF4097 family beta strand repeat-containing protein [Macrococcus hajekii]TDM02797.1 hypothetical protein ERX37_01540 [Macrococcus hajekii]GGB03965.1 hypothetical protein GCM10007190_10010 [Macrococcus hajekii]